ncbi:hypothetical protein LJR074_003461 [Acidovorax sp. LjRoot74]|uniref:hypothetical protein n=1 Tax=Acidovorax sp. LjRoot74 TaxID=3342337 RepID=UPI003ECFB902
MHDLIALLVDAIYSEPRAGRLMPARIELGPDLFRQFQRKHREALAAMLPEAGNVYPGSLACVPVVEATTPGPCWSGWTVPGSPWPCRNNFWNILQSVL